MSAAVLDRAGDRRNAAARLDLLRRPLDLCALALTGAAAWRGAAARTHLSLVQPLPLTCRIAVVPTTPGCGATTVALQLTGALTRARRTPALLLSASPGSDTVADHLPFARRWPLEEPLPAATPPARLGPALRDSAGCGPDGLTSCLRLPTAQAGVPSAWHRARRELGHFFDSCLTEFGPLTPAESARIAPFHHAVVLVSPARRREVERTRGHLRELAAAVADRPTEPGRGRRPAVLHAVVATAPGHPLIPRLGPDETLIPYDPALLRQTTPIPLRRRTAVAITALAARAVDGAARSVRGKS
ncbi:hypothetical protein [Actinomyces sp.]|uniref:hypothetical protein n=1 Tax=Actinomyces sp. TaxID=29317 RepID=UPI0026DA98AD|nr:hypothetical protein [Actinomyces sp.]MDO4901816.1 hypothetical protein [Actinomyces sp.]